ncbi:CRISPR-associated endonuclease Cas1 [Saccharolobus solfataricus]|nr:CRISPR-associated endonuclease Cas1 [Saccharolobus solfataricus]AKA74480.1 CRISPR-associated endonuclease Cas1 [Saccharolobus solfataricus]AKA77176.1 CRISPR-associated endonuclease Cas1 [Saccharolobus solfataricus]AKA79868.1 CRISPR-associated endonuclease Cas1 [Saccharolobus solfataricus]AZF68959.1 CRISPR-associated endonuclease Cas1 [Saccharolobus solfataricus]AZF71579.1 CRISPR-associated endonuclease Cas1 [Saccharolobus solfataricus]
MDKKIAFVKDYGAYLKVEKGLITCKIKNQVKWSIAPTELHSIVVLTNSSISSEVVKVANEYGIEIVFFNKHEPYAKLIPAKYAGSFKVWLKQLTAWKRRKVEFAKAFIYGKVHNQWVTLRYYERKYGYNLTSQELDRLAREITFVNTAEEVMQKEAEAAKVYWRGVKSLLPKSLGFKGRMKRVSDNLDPFNRALNIGYGMLRKVVWGAVISVGLNPYIGFLHKFRSGRISLVFDLMEEFRSPFVDRKLIGLARESADKVTDLKTVYSLFSDVKEDEIYTQARRLVNAILNDEEYRPYLAK